MAVDRDDDEGVAEEGAEDDGGEDQAFEDEYEGVLPVVVGHGSGRQRRMELVKERWLRAAPARFYLVAVRAICGRNVTVNL